MPTALTPDLSTAPDHPSPYRTLSQYRSADLQSGYLVANRSDEGSRGWVKGFRVKDLGCILVRLAQLEFAEEKQPRCP
eukprot:3051985-Rhodomonas_salina.1